MVRTKIIVHRKITWLLLFFIFSLAIVSWLIYSNKKNIERTNLGTDQTHEIIEGLQQMITAVAGSGFTYDHWLTSHGPASTLQPGNLRQELRAELDSLQQLTRQYNDQPENIALLRKHIENGPINDSLSHFLYSMISEERRLLAVRKALNEKANGRTAIGLIIARVAATLFIGIVLIRVNRDITQRIRTQEQLVKAIREAQEAKKMQEQFLANMSHEIRTPMNGIKGMTDLLLDTPLTEKQHELARIIKSSAGNLLVIINDILDFSKIKAGKLNIEKIDFSIQEVMDSAAAILEHRLKKKGLQLKVQLDPDIPERLTGDPHRLYQVLVNILGNAIKFTQHGGVHMKVELQQQMEDRVLLAFSVADTGIGISPESIPYIFDSFSQAGQDISRRYGGTGLGLTICKQLLHLQGGDISAVSIKGQGSTFHFHLPYEYAKVQKSDRPVSPALIHDYSNLLTGKSFLVVEDNEINQKLIDYVLKKAGGDVELACNGAEAIKCLEDGKNFDLIIMDLQMPEMDGYAATQYIRKDLRMKTPIIAMTATAMKGEQMQCIESGMNEYMTKPFEFTDLYKRIGGLLT